ncbi:MAG: Cof-type HAD-IIB family hydrolase [Eubacteriales bacterium]|nr:Cof-type HAD-IIB family hydrolase [Eubacteriales bacterium]
MIKFIASDLDGTILKNGAQSVDSSLIEVIDRLTSMGYIFAPASGRQITSLKRLFGHVADRLMYIAENGALVEYKGEVIAKTPMERQLALDLINDLVRIPNCEALVSGQHTAYIKPKSEEFEYRMTKVVNYHTTKVESFEDIKEDILKVSVCDMSGIVNSQDYLMKVWGENEKLEAAVSGELFLDFMDSSVSKGNAVEKIQKHFNINASECMAFGDNYNDISMLDAVRESYVMEKAVSDVKSHGKYVTDWVEATLRKQFLD